MLKNPTLQLGVKARGDKGALGLLSETQEEPRTPPSLLIFQLPSVIKGQIYFTITRGHLSQQKINLMCLAVFQTSNIKTEVKKSEINLKTIFLKSKMHFTQLVMIFN